MIGLEHSQLERIKLDYVGSKNQTKRCFQDLKFWIGFDWIGLESIQLECIELEWNDLERI